MSVRAAFFGSFDPFTLGHLSVIEQTFSEGMAEQLVVLVTKNYFKSHLLTRANAAALLSRCLPQRMSNSVEVLVSESPLVVFPQGIDFAVRGVRNFYDVAYEGRVSQALFGLAAIRLCSPIPIRYVNNLNKPASSYSSSGAREIIYSRHKNLTALADCIPEPACAILQDVCSDIRPDASRPKTIRDFNALLAQRLH